MISGRNNSHFGPVGYRLQARSEEGMPGTAPNPVLLVQITAATNSNVEITVAELEAAFNGCPALQAA